MGYRGMQVGPVWQASNGYAAKWQVCHHVSKPIMWQSHLQDPDDAA